MRSSFRHWALKSLAIAAALPSLLSGQTVVINELSATQSDRVVRYNAAGAPELGVRPYWYEVDFPLSTAWAPLTGPLGSGFTGISNMQAQLARSPAFYVRREFTLTAAQAASTDPLQLIVDYCDGFVCYLNGVEVSRRNAGGVRGPMFHDQTSFNVRTSTRPTTNSAETIALGTGASALREGRNVIAFQMHNNLQGDATLLLDATLRLNGTTPQVLVNPTDQFQVISGEAPPSGGLVDPSDYAIASGPVPGPNWTQVSYPDTSWTTAPGPFGYVSPVPTNTALDILPQLGTQVLQMLNTNASIYMRRSFELTQADIDAITNLSLTADWDDGYVVYLNGNEISRANVAGNPGTFVPFTTLATLHNSARDGGVAAPGNTTLIATLPVTKSQLRVGTNVISAQLHNNTLGSSDLILDLQMTATGLANPALVTKGSEWRYIIPTSEFGVPAAVPPRPVPEYVDWVERKIRLPPLST
jgi:hypothetical protein